METTGLKFCSARLIHNIKTSDKGSRAKGRKMVSLYVTETLYSATFEEIFNFFQILIKSSSSPPWGIFTEEIRWKIFIHFFKLENGDFLLTFLSHFANFECAGKLWVLHVERWVKIENRKAWSRPPQFWMGEAAEIRSINFLCQKWARWLLMKVFVLISKKYG